MRPNGQCTRGLKTSIARDGKQKQLMLMLASPQSERKRAVQCMGQEAKAEEEEAPFANPFPLFLSERRRLRRLPTDCALLASDCSSQIE